jgi:hypothetical protein
MKIRCMNQKNIRFAASYNTYAHQGVEWNYFLCLFFQGCLHIYYHYPICLYFMTALISFLNTTCSVNKSNDTAGFTNQLVGGSLSPQDHFMA